MIPSVGRWCAVRAGRRADRRATAVPGRDPVRARRAASRPADRKRPSPSGTGNPCHGPPVPSRAPRRTGAGPRSAAPRAPTPATGPRRDRDAGDRVRRAVGEPGDPRPAGLALDVGRHRRLHGVRLPHLVAPAPRRGQENVMLARRPLPCRPLPSPKSGPLLRRQITAEDPVQRRQRRCVCGRRLPGSTQDQSAVDRPHVPLPQRQRSTDLGRDREPCIDPGACAVPARAGARAVRTRRPTVVSPACPSGRRAR